MTLIDQINRLLAPIRALLNSMATKGSVDTVDDSGAMQVLKVVTGDGETLDRLERLQPMGLTSVPQNGDEVIVLALNGDLEHAIAVQVGASSRRPTGLAAGEVAVWRDVSNKIVFKSNGDIEMYASGDNIKIGSTVKKLINEEFQSLFNNHVHNYNAVSGVGTPTVGSTGKPASSTGTGALDTGSFPAVPPTGLLGDGLTDTHKTSKTQAE